MLRLIGEALHKGGVPALLVHDLQYRDRSAATPAPAAASGAAATGDGSAVDAAAGDAARSDATRGDATGADAAAGAPTAEGGEDRQ